MGLDFISLMFVALITIFMMVLEKDPKYFEDLMCVPLVGCVTWRLGSVFFTVNVSLRSGCTTSVFQFCVFLSCFS